VIGSPGILEHIEQAIEANRRPTPGSEVNHSHNHVLLEQHGYKQSTDPSGPLPNPHDRRLAIRNLGGQRSASRGLFNAPIELLMAGADAVQAVLSGLAPKMPE
jgi:hypothetical protein